MNRHTITLSQIENQTGADFLGYVVNWRLMNIRVQEADLKAALERAGFSNHLPAHHRRAKHYVAPSRHGYQNVLNNERA